MSNPFFVVVPSDFVAVQHIPLPPTDLHMLAQLSGAMQANPHDRTPQTHILVLDQVIDIFVFTTASTACRARYRKLSFVRSLTSFAVSLKVYYHPQSLDLHLAQSPLSTMHPNPLSPHNQSLGLIKLFLSLVTCTHHFTRHSGSSSSSSFSHSNESRKSVCFIGKCRSPHV